MNPVRKLLAQKRVRAARAEASKAPSPRAYFTLAQECVAAGRTAEALATCGEGLALFPGNDPLARLSERLRRQGREQRIAELRRETAEAPRPALWRELCELLTETGMLSRAEETALEWKKALGDPESLVFLARARCERYFADRGRELGKLALQTLDEATTRLPTDMRPWRLRLEFLGRIGAWSDAHAASTKLLEFMPGHPELEARHRHLQGLAPSAPTVDRALIEVERTGRFPEEASAKTPTTVRTNAGSVRPVLRELARHHDVHAAMYMKGATVLMQGPKGATAERTARGVRGVLDSSRASARKLGLGQVSQIRLHGTFGVLSVAPGELDAGAIWSQSRLDPKREQALLELAGLNAEIEGAEGTQGDEA
jgi:tetratricopeptide (TPR) repeat protein